LFAATGLWRVAKQPDARGIRRFFVTIVSVVIPFDICPCG
jgi:hypothetical protein